MYSLSKSVCRFRLFQVTCLRGSHLDEKVTTTIASAATVTTTAAAVTTTTTVVAAASTTTAATTTTNTTPVFMDYKNAFHPPNIPPSN
jgi:hypothetical protein